MFYRIFFDFEVPAQVVFFEFFNKKLRPWVGFRRTLQKPNKNFIKNGNLAIRPVQRAKLLNFIFNHLGSFSNDFKAVIVKYYFYLNNRKGVVHLLK